VRQLWVALALLVGLGCGCAREETDIATAALASEPQDRSAEQVAFIAYVQTTDDGGTQAVVYYLDEDRKEVVASSAPGEPPLRVKILPEAWPERLLGYTRGPGETVVYLDSATGKLLQPDLAVALEDNPRRTLVDLIEQRALVLEYEGGKREVRPTAKLYLFRGAQACELGQVFMQSPFSSMGERYYWLSTDRNVLTWEGPGGSFEVDLRTGNVQAWDSQHVCTALPDGAGSLERWQDEAGRSRWRLYKPHSDEPVAEGEGRPLDVSPDGIYWAIVNDGEGHDPPRFVQLIPDREPNPETRIAEGAWAINGTEAQFWFAYRQRSRNETWVYRITPEGHDRFVLKDMILGSPRVLTLEDRGRIAAIVRPASAVCRKNEPHGFVYEDKLVLLDFEGKERLRTEGAFMPPCPAPPIEDFVCVVDRTPEQWRVNCVNFLTGGVETVLRCEAVSLEIDRVGTHYLAWAYRGEDTDAPYDLFVSKQSVKQWDVLAENVRKFARRPWPRRTRL